MKPISKKDALSMGKRLKINFDVVDPDEWHYGMNVELEHRDITKGDHYLTGRIALAHIKEYPDYYRRLKTMESNAEKYWARRVKPNIRLP